MTWINALFNASVQTNLVDFTGDTGITWSLVKGSVSPIVYPGSNGIVATGGASAVLAKANQVSPAPSAVLTGSLHFDAALGYDGFGYINAAGTAGYIVSMSPSKTIAVWRVTASDVPTDVAELVAASPPLTVAQGDVINVGFTIDVGVSSTDLTVSVGGVTLINGYQDTNSARLTTAGYPALYFANGTGAGTGTWINSLSADTIGGGVVQTVPDAPVIGAATPGNGYIDVAFSAPSSNGGAAIIDYTVTLSTGQTATGAGSPIRVTAPNGTAATATVWARNSVGTGAASSASNSATPSAGLIVPTAPTIGVASAGAGYVDVAFTAGAADGASATLDYTATLSTGQSATGTASPIRVPVSSTAPATATVRARNSVGLSSASAASNSVTPTLAAVTSLAPVMIRFKDRIRDTSLSTSSSSITLSGTPPAGHHSFSEYAVGTSGIPIFFGDQDSGPNWLTGLATRSATNTLTIDTILTSSAGSSAPTFGVGMKDVYVAPLASLTARKHYIDMADYDVDPIFKNDSTPGFQQAIFDALARGISTIFIPDGHYKLSGPLGVSNAQLYIPNTREANHNRSIRFIGASQPNMETQGLVSMSPPVNGVILESTLRVTSGQGFILAGEAADNGDSMKWNYTNVGFSNIGFRTKADTGMNNMSALDLSMFSQVTEFDKIRIDLNVPIISSPDPTAGGSYGVIWPPVDNHAQYHVGNAIVTGHAIGMRAGEHFDAHRVTFLGCAVPLVLTGGNHGSSINHLLVECCKTSIRMEGNHPLVIQCYSTEHNQDGHWYDFVSDFEYVSGNRKLVIVQSTVITSHVGINDAGFTTNATSANLKIIAGAGAN